MERSKELKAVIMQKNSVISDLRPDTSNMFIEFCHYLKNEKIGQRNVIFDFDVILSNGEPLQRGLVWNVDKKISYIEEILDRSNVLANIVVYLPEHRLLSIAADLEVKVIDGKQRLNAIKDFMNNEFAVYGDFYFKDIESMFISYVSRLTFVRYNENLNDKQLAFLFYKLNFYSVKQSQEQFDKIQRILNS